MPRPAPTRLARLAIRIVAGIRQCAYGGVSTYNVDKRIAEALFLEMHRSRTPFPFKAAPHQPLGWHLPVRRGFRARSQAFCRNSGSGAGRGPAADVCLL